MARTELRVTVLAAEDLKRDGGFRTMSVYSLLWIDPAMKQSTRVHRQGGRYPEWNDELVFSLGEDVLLFPHSTITIQVMSQGSRRNKLLGTTYLPLSEIARIKAMKDDPADHDNVQLQLTTPSGHVQGYISLSISLIDRSERLSTRAPVSSNQSTQTVMGYPVGLLQPTPSEMHQQVSSSATNFQAYSSSGSDFPVPTQPGGAVLYYPPSQEGSSAYIQTPQPYCPCMDQRTGRQPRRNIALALIGGAISGFIIGDILGVVF